MFIENLLDSDSQVNKAALRAVANSSVMRAAGIAIRLASFAAKQIGNGIDGLNDFAAAKEAALVRAAQLQSAGRDSQALDVTMHRLMALYLSVSARLTEESWHKPMSLDEAMVLVQQDRDYDKTEGEEYIAALSKVTGETVEQLRARQAVMGAKQTERNRELAPLARTFLEECSDTGETEDMIFADLPLQIQSAVFMKAVDNAANQLDRDVNRSMQYASSKSSVLRNIAISDVAAGKADLNQLETSFLRFMQQHRSELES